MWRYDKMYSKSSDFSILVVEKKGFCSGWITVNWNLEMSLLLTYYNDLLYISLILRIQPHPDISFLTTCLHIWNYFNLNDKRFLAVMVWDTNPHFIYCLYIYMSSLGFSYCVREISKTLLVIGQWCSAI